MAVSVTVFILFNWRFWNVISGSRKRVISEVTFLFALQKWLQIFFANQYNWFTYIYICISVLIAFGELLISHLYFLCSQKKRLHNAVSVKAAAPGGKHCQITLCNTNPLRLQITLKTCNYSLGLSRIWIFALFERDIKVSGFSHVCSENTLGMLARGDFLIIGLFDMSVCLSVLNDSTKTWMLRNQNKVENFRLKLTA